MDRILLILFILSFSVPGKSQAFFSEKGDTVLMVTGTGISKSAASPAIDTVITYEILYAKNGKPKKISGAQLSNKEFQQLKKQLKLTREGKIQKKPCCEIEVEIKIKKLKKNKQQVLIKSSIKGKNKFQYKIKTESLGDRSNYWVLKHPDKEIYFIVYMLNGLKRDKQGVQNIYFTEIKNAEKKN